jgi:outer membrane protein TolC
MSKNTPNVLFLFIFLLCFGCARNRLNIEDQRLYNARKDVKTIYESVDSEVYRLNLDDIIRIALKRNLDLLVKKREIAVKYESAMSDQLRMLPQLIANGELSGRNKPLIVSSKSVDPTVPPAPPSISSDQHVDRYDVNIIWNLLDFGLSYYKARQENNRYRMMQLEYEKIRQNLVLEITKSFWKAIAYKKAIEEGKDIVELVAEQQKKIQAQIDEHLISKVKGYATEINLLTLEIQMKTFQKEYDSAISELILKTGLPAYVRMELIEEKAPIREIVLADILELERVALQNRPELYSRDIESKIVEDEVRSAFLQMIPGIELFAGDYYDANSYLTYKHWLAAGARASYNLFALPQRIYDVKSGYKHKDLVKMNRLAESIAILSQVRLAYIMYHDNFQEYVLATKLDEVNDKLLKAAKDELQHGTLNPTEVLIYSSESLLAKANALKALGEVHVSLEQINIAIGYPRYYREDQDEESDETVGESCSRD